MAERTGDSEPPRSRSPAEVLDRLDPGDETQRNFRYQHAYGVILLLLAATRKKEYVALWCEHHEDFLAEWGDDTFDAYQIKTRREVDGPWTLKDEELRNSLQRFVRLDLRFPGKIRGFFFASNLTVLKSRSKRDLTKCPNLLIEALDQAGAPVNLPAIWKNTYDELCARCQCEPEVLASVLHRLNFAQGPGRSSFDAELVSTHLGGHPRCKDLPVSELEVLRDELMLRVHKASSRQIDDPMKHLVPLDSNDRQNPLLHAKRIQVDVVEEAISSRRTRGNPSTGAPEPGASLAELKRKYLAEIIEQASHVAPLGGAYGEGAGALPVSLEEVFIMPDLREPDAGAAPVPEQPPLGALFEIFRDPKLLANRSRLLLEGEVGLGKSVLLSRLSRELAREAQRNPEAPLPVLLDASVLAESDEVQALERRTPGFKGLLKVEGQRYVYLLDGLDEVDRHHQSRASSLLRNLASRPEIVALVMAGRPAIGITLPTEIKRLRVEPWGPEQVRHFLSRWREREPELTPALDRLLENEAASSLLPLPAHRDLLRPVGERRPQISPLPRSSLPRCHQLALRGLGCATISR